MRIAILGSGLMGKALGATWCRAGHPVTFSFARDRARLERFAATLGALAAAAEPRDAVAGADVVLVALPWHVLDDALEAAGSLAGRIVLSCSLPMASDDASLAIGHTTSGAEVLATKTGARVATVFNTVPSELVDARRERAGGLDPPQVVMCGDDTSAKTPAVVLAADAGFVAVDAGPLRMARLIEPFGLLVGALAYVAGASPALGYRFSRQD